MPCTFFSIHYSPTILSLSATQYQLLIVLFNKQGKQTAIFLGTEKRTGNKVTV